MTVSLTAIPTDFGSGGSALAPQNSGGPTKPTLATLLTEHRAALLELQAQENTSFPATLLSVDPLKGAVLVGYSGAYANVKLALDALIAGFPPPASVTGAHLAVVADDAVLGGVEVVHIIAIPTGISADKDVVLTDKTEILDVKVLKQNGAGGAADTITVKNGATAITDAMDINKADKTITSAATYDDAQTVILAGGTLRVSMINGGGHDTTCRVIVRGIRRA